MLKQALFRAHRLALFVTLVVALVATGFGHRTSAPQDQFIALALANGAALPDLCGGAMGDGQRDAHCLACQIAGSADLPQAVACQTRLDLAVVTGLGAPRDRRAPARVLDPGHGPQAPPLV